VIELSSTGSIDAMLASLDRLNPQVISQRLNTVWAKDAEKNLKAAYQDGPGGRYYTSRTGGTRSRIRASAAPSGAELSVSGPGVRANEYGAVIKAAPGRWLTFRLYNPTDTSERTGNWVRVRQVTLKAKHAVRDSGDEATRALRIHLQEVLRT